MAAIFICRLMYCKHMFINSTLCQITSSFFSKIVNDITLLIDQTDCQKDDHQIA